MPDITGQFRAFDPREVHTFKLPNGQTVTGNFLFDPTVFQIVNPQSPEAARIGNLGRNVFSGAGVAQVDFSLAKEFRIIKEHRLETRIDATNGLNHAQFLVNRAAVSLNGAMFGRVASTLGPRRVQFQLRYNF
jgi:hypothetical protein